MRESVKLPVQSLQLRLRSRAIRFDPGETHRALALRGQFSRVGEASGAGAVVRPHRRLEGVGGRRRQHGAVGAPGVIASGAQSGGRIVADEIGRTSRRRSLRLEASRLRRFLRDPVG